SGWGPGWNWGSPGPGAGSATTILTKERMGTLVVDIFDASTRKVIWRGSAKGMLTTDDETNKRKLNQAATRLFKKFPPTAAGPPSGRGAYFPLRSSSRTILAMVLRVSKTPFPLLAIASKIGSPLK